MNTFLDRRVLERLRAEYLEMPGMKLTFEQVQRLCGIEQTMCKLVLEALVKANFLCLKSDGTYVRLTEGRSTLPGRPAKAALRSVPPATVGRRASWLSESESHATVSAEGIRSGHLTDE
jgi:hypothetical protein